MILRHVFFFCDRLHACTLLLLIMVHACVTETYKRVLPHVSSNEGTFGLVSCGHHSKRILKLGFVGDVRSYPTPGVRYYKIHLIVGLWTYVCDTREACPVASCPEAHFNISLFRATPMFSSCNACCTGLFLCGCVPGLAHPLFCGIMHEMHAKY